MPRTFFETKELREKRIDTIVNVSLKLFSLYGYKRVTIDMITKECQYSHGLFYHYFSSKNEVFKEVERRSKQLFFEEFLKIKERCEPGYPFLQEAVVTIFDFINDVNNRNYYIYFYTNKKLEELNSGSSIFNFPKEIRNSLVESFSRIRKDLPDLKNVFEFKRLYYTFLTLISGLSLAKIKYPKLFKKKFDGYVFFNRLLAFAKAGKETFIFENQ